MTDSGVVVQDVWKKFHRGELHDSLRDLIPALARRMMKGGTPTALEEGDFWALREVSFTVGPGEALGIIGPNGAGKSTILKLLSRIMRPTRGSVTVTGRVGALIELAAGFHPDLTGAENVYLQGSIMGMRRKEIARKFDEIVSFAGLEDFMEMPVKRYSSGMNARLGFSIAAHLEVDVLLIDEVLAVGDFDFQAKAFKKLREVAGSGVPVVVVSHQLDRISELCTSGILLRAGRIEVRGTPAECIDGYVSSRGHPRPVDANQSLAISSVRVVPDGPVRSGDTIGLGIAVDRNGASEAERLAVWFQVRSLKTGEIVFASSSELVGVPIPSTGSFTVEATMQLNVPAGTYSIECHLWDQMLMRELDIGQPRLIEVRDGVPFMGSVQMNPAVEIRPAGDE